MKSLEPQTCSRRRGRALNMFSVLGVAALVLGILWSEPGLAEQGEGMPPQCVQSYEQSQVSRRNGKLLTARKEFATCIRTCPEKFAQQCVQWSHADQRAIPSLVVSARRGTQDIVDGELRIDGRLVAHKLDGRATELDPGPHRVQLTVGSQTQEQTVVLNETEKFRPVRFVLPEPVSHRKLAAPAEASHRFPSWVGWSAVGVGAVAAGVGTYFLLSVRSDANNLTKTCSPHCPQSDVERLQRNQTIGASLLVAGGAVAAVGVVLLVKFDAGGTVTHVSTGAMRPLGWVE